MQHGACDPQVIEGLNIHDVEAASPVHEHLGETLRAHMTRGMSLVRDPFQVVTVVKDNWELRPPKILWDGGLRCVHLAVGHLEAALVAEGFSSTEDHEAYCQLRVIFGGGFLFRRFGGLIWLRLLTWWLGDEAFQ